MHPSMFNVRVPLDDRDDVFLMNTFTDAQLIVSRDVADLLDRIKVEADAFVARGDEHEAIFTLAENGFLVEDRLADRRNVEQFFRSNREDQEQLRVTVLTTLQCNFACDYCIQGDHGDYNKTAAKMTMETAQRVAAWVEGRMDAVAPRRFSLTFFGGEPLLNLPVMYYLAERLWNSAQARGIDMLINIITNGLLLTPEVVDRLVPFGLNGVKVTLDGDRHTHDRMRPLRGGQGTFDKIIRNVRQVADRCKVSIGGNFDESSFDSFPALLDFLREEAFADKLAKVAFKPVIREPKPQQPKGMIPLTVVGGSSKPLNGACMTAAGTATSSSACDTCHFQDEQLTFLREETARRGFKTIDGVHMGPCEIHKKHAHSISPDGSLFACPGYAANAAESVGHIDGRQETWRNHAADRFERLAAWKECRDCAFIPVCAGGCTVAAHTELGDINKPNCHKPVFEAGVISLAREAARNAEPALAG